MANKIKIAGRTFNIGNKLGAGELKKIAKKTEYTQESIVQTFIQRQKCKTCFERKQVLRQFK
jgi:hypothetical protein